MPFDFKLPDLGEGITEGEIRKWLVKEGDAIDEHQTVPGLAGIGRSEDGFDRFLQIAFAQDDVELDSGQQVHLIGPGATG